MSLHIKRHEFACNHCGENAKIASELYVLLELVRLRFGGKPLVITSGYLRDHLSKMLKCLDRGEGDASKGNTA